MTHARIGTQPFLHFLVKRAVWLRVVDAGPGHIPRVCNRERSKPAVRETRTFCSVVNTSLPHSQYTLSRLRGYQQRRPLGILANCSELVGWTENCSYTCFDYSFVYLSSTWECQEQVNFTCRLEDKDQGYIPACNQDAELHLFKLYRSSIQSRCRIAPI